MPVGPKKTDGAKRRRHGDDKGVVSSHDNTGDTDIGAAGFQNPARGFLNGFRTDIVEERAPGTDRERLALASRRIGSLELGLAGVTYDRNILGHEWPLDRRVVPDPRRWRHRRAAVRINQRVADRVDLAFPWRQRCIRALLALVERGTPRGFFVGLSGDETIDAIGVEGEGLEVR